MRLDLFSAVLKWFEQQSSHLFLWETKWGRVEVCALRAEKIFGVPLELLGLQSNTLITDLHFTWPRGADYGVGQCVLAFWFGSEGHRGQAQPLHEDESGSGLVRGPRVRHSPGFHKRGPRVFQQLLMWPCPHLSSSWRFLNRQRVFGLLNKMGVIFSVV